MGRLDDEVRQLLEQSERTRHQFLRAELQVCTTALESARLELSLGHFDVVQKEFHFLERGLHTIERFSTPLPAPQRKEWLARIAAFKAELEPVRMELNSHPAMRHHPQGRSVTGR